jgi:hypothetical protein
MASGRKFTKASTIPFISPLSSEIAAASVAALPPQVQQLLKEFLLLLRPSVAPRSTALYVTSIQVAPSPCSPALGGWTQKTPHR